MRTHAEIIAAAGGYKALAEKLTSAGYPFTPEQTRFWQLRGAVPPERWPGVVAAHLASLEELAEAYAVKKLALIDKVHA